MIMIDANYEKLFDTPPYSLDKMQKAALYEVFLERLYQHHKSHCDEYNRITEVLGKSSALPVRRSRGTIPTP